MNKKNGNINANKKRSDNEHNNEEDFKPQKKISLIF